MLHKTANYAYLYCSITQKGTLFKFLFRTLNPA